MSLDQQIKSLQDSLRQTLTWFLSPKSLGLEKNDGEHAVHMIAKNIADGYAILEQKLKLESCVDIKITQFRPMEYQLKDVDYLAPVVELGESVIEEGISEHVTDFMIHGSIATMDYSLGWSDFDTFVIISTDTVLNPRALFSLRTKLLDAYRFLSAIDPLQHHGFIICTEIDLKHYNEGIMPIAVLERAKSYIGSTTLRINPITDIERERNILSSRAKFFRESGNIGVMKHHPYEGIYLESHYKNAKNSLFQLKYLLGIGAIAPCYYLGALGEFAYKKDAIEQIKPLLSPDSKEFLESTTNIRIEWPKREEHPYIGNQIPKWFKEYVDPNYIVNLGRLLTDLENTAQDNTSPR